MAAASQNKTVSQPHRYRLRVERRNGGGWNVNLQWLKENESGDPVWVFARCLDYAPMQREAIKLRKQYAEALGIDAER